MSGDFVTPLRTALGIKWRIANNIIAGIRSHFLVHLFVGLMVLAILVGGGMIFFQWLFLGLMSFEPFGPVLMNRLMGLVFFAFFAMLVFSNLVITLSTTYISREIDFYMAQPLSHSVTFTVKLVESIVYSSWAFLLLSFPLFVAYGNARHVDWTFYPLAFLLIVPFTVIPAGLGALVTMVVSAILPARRSRAMTVLFGLALALISALFVRGIGSKTLGGQAGQFEFSELLNFLDVGSSALLPSLWLREGVIAASEHAWGGFLFWWLMLLTTALMILQVCLWLIPALYYRGWCLTRETSSAATRRSGGVFGIIDKSLAWLPLTTRAFLSKDIRTFWRDPSQWSQIIMLMGLSTLYVVNIRNAAAQSMAVGQIVEGFRNVITFFNLGAVCFMLSILSTRFVYPSLSLEGKQFWIVGLAPLRREAVVWEKYWACLVVSLIVIIPLVVLSALILKIEGTALVLSLITVTIMTLGLTSLAVGLGALTPNFNEDNPARIANGLGGTLNVILSMIHIGVTTLLLFFPARLADLGRLETSSYWQSFGTLHIGVLIALQIVVIVLPMWLGLRHWRRLEF